MAGSSQGDDLYQRLLAGDRSALAKAITAVESGSPAGGALLARLAGQPRTALVVGVTGAPGTGKSTLVSALVRALRARGRRVGVIAVDPSSPVSGGAILGDRLRMAEHAADPGVFIRSLSSRGRTGGLAPATALVVEVMEAAARDVVVIETVGAGQSEVEVAAIADVKLVVSAPGLGDDIQALKAGILEIADILVVNKADRPGAEATAAQLRGMLALRSGPAREVPVVLTSAAEGTGVAELTALIEARGRAGSRLRRSGDRLKGLLAEEIARQLRERLAAGDALDAGLLRALAAGELGLAEAARDWLARCLPQ